MTASCASWTSRATSAGSTNDRPRLGGGREGERMKRSTDRIITTHVGSLPQSAELLRLSFAKDAGQPYDREEYTRQVRDAVTDVVRRQAEVGIDVLGDGEQSKH